MDLIDKEWLHARGDLHDATLIGFRVCGQDFEVTLDDEWVNERGETFPVGQTSPGHMIFENASIAQGEPSEATGGWIEGIEMRGAVFHFNFFDRGPLAIEASAAKWRQQT